jgi:hypothetical protein
VDIDVDTAPDGYQGHAIGGEMTAGLNHETLRNLVTMMHLQDM